MVIEFCPRLFPPGRKTCLADRESSIVLWNIVFSKKKKKKIKQRKNYVYRDWKSGKIAIGFSYISFTRTHAHSLSLSLSLSLLILLFNFLFHSLFFLFFSTFFSHFIFPPLLLTPSFVPRYSSLSLSLPSFSSHLSLLGSG